MIINIYIYNYIIDNLVYDYKLHYEIANAKNINII